MPTRSRYLIAAATLAVTVLLAFVIAKLTTHSTSDDALNQTTASPTSSEPAGSESPSATESSSVSPSESGSAAASPSVSPSPSASPSVSPPVSATPTSPSPSASPLTVGQLVKQVADCKLGGCTVVSTFASAQSGAPLRFALVQLPVDDGTVEVPLRAALFDTRTQKLTWKSAVLTGVPATDGGRDAAVQDATGHIAFTLHVGAHSSNLYVLDPANGTNVKWYGESSADGSTGYFSDTPGARAEDLDGDGVLEIVLPENDYDPSYAEGSTTEFRFAWNGKDAYVPSGCTFYEHGAATGTDYEAGDTQCQAG
ncbi:MAG: hypothetical protein JWM93_137 [Frankiales bacterium]|nr:hypothetical protein [Frankiales bacterium]